MPACKTLNFTSPSLSYGSASVSVQLLPRDSNRAPRVSWNVGGRPLYRTDQVKLFESLHFDVCRTTIYSDCGLDAGHDGMHAGRKCAALATPEHLAPVFLLWPHVSFDVNVDGVDVANPVPEIPLMDGSALPFFLALRRACPGNFRFTMLPCQDSGICAMLRTSLPTVMSGSSPPKPSRWSTVWTDPMQRVSSPAQPFRCMDLKTCTACFRPGLLSWKRNMNRPERLAFWQVLRKVAAFSSNLLWTSPFTAFPKNPPCTKF